MTDHHVPYAEAIAWADRAERLEELLARGWRVVDFGTGERVGVEHPDRPGTVYSVRRGRPRGRPVVSEHPGQAYLDAAWGVAEQRRLDAVERAKRAPRSVWYEPQDRRLDRRAARRSANTGADGKTGPASSAEREHAPGLHWLRRPADWSPAAVVLGALPGASGQGRSVWRCGVRVEGRPGGPPGRRARAAGEVSGPAAPSNPDLPVHRAAAERAAGYVWEPFQPGNALSVRHGAHSERVIGPLAAELAGFLVEQYPDLAEPRYRFSVNAWSRAEARAALLSLFLDAQGIVHTDGDQKGEPRDGLFARVGSAGAQGVRGAPGAWAEPGFARTARDGEIGGGEGRRGPRRDPGGGSEGSPGSWGRCGVNGPEAQAWLAALLAGGPVASGEVAAKAEAAGLRPKTLRNASEALGVEKVKFGAPGSRDQGWTWRLSAPAGAVSEAQRGRLQDAALELLGGLVIDDGRCWGDAAVDVQWEDARAIARPGEPDAVLLARQVPRLRQDRRGGGHGGRRDAYPSTTWRPPLRARIRP